MGVCSLRSLCCWVLAAAKNAWRGFAFAASVGESSALFRCDFRLSSDSEVVFELVWLLCLRWLASRPLRSLLGLGSGGSKGAGGDELVSFDFDLSKVCDSDLDSYATKYGWLDRSKARACRGEVVPKPEGDEVVVFTEFFLAGLRFPVAPFVLGVLKRFKLRFHQLNPSCFVHTHRVHTQPRKAGEVQAQFGVYTFCYRTGKEVLVQAQRNKWTPN